MLLECSLKTRCTVGKLSHRTQPACDRYDNIYAIRKTIEALRDIARWSTGDMVEQAFTGFVALPAPQSPYEVLGIRTGASEDEIEAAYRARAKAAHPEIGPWCFGTASTLSPGNWHPPRSTCVLEQFARI